MWYRCANDAYELHISLWHSNLIWIVTYSWFMTWLCGFGRALLEETVTRKLQSVYLDLFFKSLLFHVAYILFCRFFLSLLTLSGWVIIAACESVSVQGFTVNYGLQIMCYLWEGRYWFQCIGYDYTAYMDIAVRCPRKAVNFNHSLVRRLVFITIL